MTDAESQELALSGGAEPASAWGRMSKARGRLTSAAEAFTKEASNARAGADNLTEYLDADDELMDAAIEYTATRDIYEREQLAYREYVNAHPMPKCP